MENILRHNDAIREEERVCMYAAREEELVRKAQNTIIILSESLSSNESLEILSLESFGSERRQIPTKPIMSSNKSSTFRPHRRQINRQKHRQMTHLIYVQG